MSAWLTNRNSNLNTLIARNAGIGTTTPAYTLDVAGVTRSAGVQYQDGSVAVTATPTLDYSTFGQNWVQLPSSQVNTTNWQASAVSATGQYQLLGNDAGTIIYSSNYGQTWTSASGSGGNIGYIAMSASGQYAVMASNGGVYYSSNYGQTWTKSNQNTGNNYQQVCMSASGQYAGLTTSTANTTVYYSINYGQTWTASALSTATAGYNSIGYSASGQYQVAVTAASTSAAIYYSSNYGATWTASVSTLGSYAAQYLAMSASGQYVTIATGGNGVYYSSNYGVTFTNSTSGLPASTLHGVTMSASGQYQILGLFNANCGVYYSSNYGVTWALGFSLTGYVFTVAMSANAQYMLIPIYSVGGYQSVTRSPGLYSSGNTIVTGNVGIGITNPNASLQIYNTTGNRLTSLYIYTAQAGIVLDSTLGGGAGTRSYNIWSTNSGDSTGAGCFAIYDTTGGAYRMVINSSGYVGIGTVSPAYPLHIESNPNLTYNLAGYLGSAGFGSGGNASFTQSTSFFARGWCMTAAAWGVTSDRRIKTNINPVSSMISIINQVNIVKYDYIDPRLGNEACSVIAQELNEIFPNAINVTTDYVPNIFKKCTHTKQNNIVTLSVILTSTPDTIADIKVGSNLKLIISNDTKTEKEIITPILSFSFTDNIITVTAWDNYLDSTTVIVFGTQVNNFLSIDKPQLGMLALQGVKELHQIIKTQQTQIDQLIQRLAAAGIA